MRVFLLFLISIFAVGYALACIFGFVRWFNRLKWWLLKRFPWLQRREEEDEEEDDGQSYY